MNNSTIRIALSSVLIYLLFKKLYNFLTILILWGNVELRIENEPILIIINLALGVLVVWLLVIFSNNILAKGKIENRVIYLLIGLTVLLTISTGVLKKFYGEYLVNIDLDSFNMTYLIQFGWTKTLGIVFPAVGLLYFLWRLERR